MEPANNTTAGSNEPKPLPKDPIAALIARAEGLSSDEIVKTLNPFNRGQGKFYPHSRFSEALETYSRLVQQAKTREVANVLEGVDLNFKPNSSEESAGDATGQSAEDGNDFHVGDAMDVDGEKTDSTFESGIGARDVVGDGGATMSRDETIVDAVMTREDTVNDPAMSRDEMIQPVATSRDHSIEDPAMFHDINTLPKTMPTLQTFTPTKAESAATTAPALNISRRSSASDLFSGSTSDPIYVDEEIAKGLKVNFPADLEDSGVPVPKLCAPPHKVTSKWSASLETPPACLEMVPELPSETDDGPWFVIGGYDLQKEAPSLAEEPRPVETPRKGSLPVEWVSLDNEGKLGASSPYAGLSCAELTTMHPNDNPSQFDTTHEHMLAKTDYLNALDEAKKREATEEAAFSLKAQVRRGNLTLWRWNEKRSMAVLEQTVPQPCGIFDIKFHDSTPMFAVAGTTGTIAIYRIFTRGGHKTMELQSNHQVAPSDVMITALCWHNERLVPGMPRKDMVLGFTTSAGDVRLAQLHADKTLQILNNEESLMIHRFPVFMGGQSASAWNCGFAYLKYPRQVSVLEDMTTNAGDRVETYAHKILFLSGGEDMKLRTVSGDSLPIIIDPMTAQEYSGHDAGVTAILPLLMEDGSSIVLTGGYDDHIRVLSTRGTSFRELASQNLGGGVWRLKLIDYLPRVRSNGDIFHVYFILASCMYAGCKILEVRGPVNAHLDWKISVTAHLLEHESLNYASDVFPLKAKASIGGSGDEMGENGNDRERWKEKRLIVSTSFSNKILRVWEWDPAKEPPKKEGMGKEVEK